MPFSDFFEEEPVVQGVPSSSRDRLLNDIKYADIAANLTDPMFKGIYKGVKTHKADLDRVLKRCWNNNFDKILITGTNLENSREGLALARTDERLYCTVGCHPLKCNEFDSYGEEYYYDELLRLASSSEKKITAIGEIGLDYHPDRIHECPKEIQLNSLKTADQIEVVKYIPTSRMMLESDAPWCKIGTTYAGHKYVKDFFRSVPKQKWNKNEMVKGRSEPSHVLEVLQAVSKIKNFDAEILALVVYKNAERVYFPLDTASGNFSRMIMHPEVTDASEWY